MCAFLDRDYLFDDQRGRELFEAYGRDLPIIDYHNHLPVQEVAEDKAYENITQVWLGGDHYKWRAMRNLGIDEAYITGDKSDFEKFEAYLSCLPLLIGNPLYHWSTMEMDRYFGIKDVLNKANARSIYDRCNELLKKETARSLLKKMKVQVIGTTDHPLDDLRWHDAIAAQPEIGIKAVPTFRPDDYVNLEKPAYPAAIKRMEETLGQEVGDFKTLRTILVERLHYFIEHGCRAADHGLDRFVYEPADEAKAEVVMQKRLAGETVTEAEQGVYKATLLKAFCEVYSEHDMVMQIHFGCYRNANTPAFEKLGPDTGYDAINATTGVDRVGPFLDELVQSGCMPKTILYSLNPLDDSVLDVLASCYRASRGGAPCKHGAAWWFNDTKEGIESHMASYASHLPIGGFLGMLTDSRSFLSFARHEYFRRLACNYIGKRVEAGEYPDDEEALAELVRRLCVYNTADYFGIPVNE